MHIDIIKASYNGDIETLKICINQNIDVNAKDDYVYTPLHWVFFLGEVGKDRVEMARLLIEAGADVNSNLPDEGPSILSTTCQAGNYAIVEMLVCHGADINFSGDGSTPLIGAVQCGKVDIVSYLLEKGADYGVPEASGQTPLDIAKDYEREDIVELLMVFSNKH